MDHIDIVEKMKSLWESKTFGKRKKIERYMEIDTKDTHRGEKDVVFDSIGGERENKIVME